MSLRAEALRRLGIDPSKVKTETGEYLEVRPEERNPSTIKRQTAKPQTRFTYNQGPVWYLAQQIVREMQTMGHEAYIETCYRSVEDQKQLYYCRQSRWRPYRSAHQYMLAVDILHPRYFYDPPPDHRYWEDLAVAVENVRQRFSVDLEQRDHPMSQHHIELRGWQSYATEIGEKKPEEIELAQWFEDVLPKQWFQFCDSIAGHANPVTRTRVNLKRQQKKRKE